MLKLLSLAGEQSLSLLDIETLIESVKMTRTPFVNRQRELVELALWNAKFISTIQREEYETTGSWRGERFVFAAQMYGAGKTRIGNEFIHQIRDLSADLSDDSSDDLSNNIFQTYCPSVLKKRLPDLLPIVQQFSANAVDEYIDCGTLENYQGLLRRLKTDCFTEYVLNTCAEKKKPVFFYLDELGNFGVDNLREVRDACFSALKYLPKEQLAAGHFPFFFFSGRGTAYDQLGSPGSAVESHWLILEPLKVEHVKEVLSKSTFAGSNFSFHLGCSEEELVQLIEHTIAWTGGAPRPLVYVFHMLEALHKGGPQFPVADLGRTFRTLVDYIRSEPRLQCELGPVSLRSAELSSRERRAYDNFVYLDTRKELLNVNFSLACTNKPASRYLRSFNIFATKEPGGKIRLVAPQFVSSLLAMTRSGGVHGVMLNRLSIKGIDMPTTMEETVQMIIVAYHRYEQYLYEPHILPFLVPDDCFLTKGVKLHSWKNRIPVIQSVGKLTKKDIDQIVENRDIGDDRRQLRHDLLGYFLDQLEVGSVVVTGKKSSTADIFVKTGEKELIEIQCKSGVSTLSATDIVKEVEKSVVYIAPDSDYTSTFVLVSASGYSKSAVDSARSKLQEDHRPTILLHFPKEECLEEFFGPDILSRLQRPQK